MSIRVFSLKNRYVSVLACLIRDDFGKSLEDLPRKQSSDLSKNQSVF
jgi:hypothetical protein